MKKRKVIKSNNNKTVSPIGTGILLYLFFKELNAPDWLYGVIGTILVVWLITFIVDRFNTEEVDIFKDK